MMKVINSRINEITGLNDVRLLELQISKCNSLYVEEQCSNFGQTRTVLECSNIHKMAFERLSSPQPIDATAYCRSDVKRNNTDSLLKLMFNYSGLI
jgi:hypothetical protein